MDTITKYRIDTIRGTVCHLVLTSSAVHYFLLFPTSIPLEAHKEKFYKQVPRPSVGLSNHRIKDALFMTSKTKVIGTVS